MEKLYNKYRVKSLDDLVGDLPFITKLKEDRKRGYDHTYMFYGSHGVSKTSIARIIGTSLPKCYIEEISASVDNGVATSKNIAKNVSNVPLGYKTKLIILDEIQRASSQFFDSLLKATEEPGENTYFVICTTEENKIPKNIKSRFTKIKFDAPDTKSLREHLLTICEKEGIVTDRRVLSRICSKNNRIPRDCISDLELIRGINDFDDQLDLLKQDDVATNGYALAQALSIGDWKTISSNLKNVNASDVEGIRRTILGYFNKVLISGTKKNGEFASGIISDFEDPFFDSGVAGLSRRLYDNC